MQDLCVYRTHIRMIVGLQNAGFSRCDRRNRNLVGRVINIIVRRDGHWRRIIRSTSIRIPRLMLSRVNIHEACPTSVWSLIFARSMINRSIHREKETTLLCSTWPRDTLCAVTNNDSPGMGLLKRLLWYVWHRLVLIHVEKNFLRMRVPGFI